MKKILYFTLLVCFVFFSCKEKEQIKDKYLYNKDVDICNYTGNAFVFITKIYLYDKVTFRKDEDIHIVSEGYIDYDEHIYIIPIPEITDSNEFKKVDAFSTIGNRNYISLAYSRTKYFKDLIENPTKEYLPNFVCSLPKLDSIAFARVYLSYTNFKDVTNFVKSKPYSDSCDYRYIVVDSKTEFPIFHIYQK